MVARKGAARRNVGPALANCPINIRFGAFICVCSFLFADRFINEAIPKAGFQCPSIYSECVNNVFLISQAQSLHVSLSVRSCSLTLPILLKLRNKILIIIVGFKKNHKSNTYY